MPPEAGNPPKAPKAPKVKQAVHQAVWRWHFYAGIIFAPFLIILAVSGAAYLFKPQIEGILYKDLLTVSLTGQQAMSPADIIAKTEKGYPGSTVNSLTLTNDPKAAYSMSVNYAGKATTMYADPYTGNINGSLDSNKTFSAVFKKLHSQLLIDGTWTNRLVELAACWGVILIATGLILWWPRSRSGIWGTILPRLSKPGSRMFWRDLHAVPAFWISIMLILLILTGLPWSGVLGPKISKLADNTNTNVPPYAYSFLPGPESVTVKSKDIADDLPWATQDLPVPLSSASGGYMTLSVNDVEAIVDKQNVLKPYTITLPSGEAGVFTVSTSHKKPDHDATLHIDQYSGAVLTDVRFADYGIAGKLISYGIALHEGRLFGLANQLLGLVAALGLVLISISSYFMWRKRKPDGLGAPSRTKNRKVSIAVLALMLVCGVLMPLVGVSLVVVLLLDWLVIRRIKPLKTWFAA
ncbi:PepSY domain-containing protein [Cohnella fermenti]|uniref:PepSY domain-containing protein n=1 Tax=Cohnella fermenti TaxID=2565925 RepID=A0A4S4BH26_9BACL|nr:PepSY domain-containing protein [Cohnella fermenti]THF73808.1 PepSY domain-containing protein [Cohnella fermenti]